MERKTSSDDSVPTNLSDLRRSNPKVKGGDLHALIEAHLSDALIKLFERFTKTQDDLDKARKAVEKLEKKLKDLPSEVEKIASDWLGDQKESLSWLVNDTRLGRLKQIAKDRQKLKKKASKSAAVTDSGTGGRTDWTPAKLAAVLSGADEGGTGYINAKDLQTPLKCSNIDLLAKRLQLVTGELGRSFDGGTYQIVNLDADHSFEKVSGKRATYGIKKNKVLSRLK